MIFKAREICIPRVLRQDYALATLYSTGYFFRNTIIDEICARFHEKQNFMFNIDFASKISFTVLKVEYGRSTLIMKCNSKKSEFGVCKPENISLCLKCIQGLDICDGV